MSRAEAAGGNGARWRSPCRDAGKGPTEVPWGRRVARCGAEGGSSLRPSLEGRVPRIRLRCLGGSLLALGALLGGTVAADAHPHVWIETAVTFVFDQGKVISLRLEWTFDEKAPVLFVGGPDPPCRYDVVEDRQHPPYFGWCFPSRFASTAGGGRVRSLVWRALLGGLLVLLAVGRVWAATNPLTGTALERPRAEEAARPGLVQDAGRALLRLQRTMNRSIGQHLRAIWDGDSPWALVVGLGFAFLYGVLHTLGPGHGKVVVVSYFLSRNARLWRGLRMGVQIALTHVASAVALCWLADLSLRAVLGDSSGAIRTMQAASYGTTGGVGALMLVRAVRRALRPQDPGTLGAASTHVHECRHLSLVSFCVGLVPCTGAVLIMLFALANDMLIAGTAMVAAIAAGMAVTMSALGMVGILTRGAVVSRWSGSGRRSSAAALALEVGGALVIVLSAALLVGSLWS